MRYSKLCWSLDVSELKIVTDNVYFRKDFLQVCTVFPAKTYSANKGCSFYGKISRIYNLIYFRNKLRKRKTDYFWSSLLLMYFAKIILDDYIYSIMKYSYCKWKLHDSGTFNLDYTKLSILYYFCYFRKYMQFYCIKAALYLNFWSNYITSNNLYT